LILEPFQISGATELEHRDATTAHHDERRSRAHPALEGDNLSNDRAKRISSPGTSIEAAHRFR
jgi:hypothetical protein